MSDELEKVKVKKYAVTFNVRILLRHGEEPLDLTKAAELVTSWAAKIMDDGSEVAEVPIAEETDLVGQYELDDQSSTARSGIYRMSYEASAWADEVSADPQEGAAQVLGWATEVWDLGFEVKDCPIENASLWSAKYVGEGHVEL